MVLHQKFLTLVTRESFKKSKMIGQTTSDSKTDDGIRNQILSKKLVDEGVYFFGNHGMKMLVFC